MEDRVLHRCVRRLYLTVLEQGYLRSGFDIDLCGGASVVTTETTTNWTEIINGRYGYGDYLLVVL